MNEIQRLKTRVVSRFPEVKISIDEPVKSSGVWFLDIQFAGKHIAVQWQSAHGYGVSDIGSGDSCPLDSCPDWIFIDRDEVFRKIITLLGGNP